MAYQRRPRWRTRRPCGLSYMRQRIEKRKRQIPRPPRRTRDANEKRGAPGKFFVATAAEVYDVHARDRNRKLRTMALGRVQ